MNELQKIQRDLKAPKSQVNRHLQTRYRSCEDILEALKPLLWQYDCQLTLSDRIEQIGERYYVISTARLIMPDGKTEAVEGWANEDLTRKGLDGSQVTGSASSYARKYALNGLFLIDDTRDADAKQTITHDPIPAKMRACSTLEELQGLWATIPNKAQYAELKNQIKATLQ